MSEINPLKFLYETVVYREIVSNTSETKIDESGISTTVSTPLKTIKPVKVAIRHPDRKLTKGADIFYSKMVGEYLKKGLMPQSLVAKRYANDGGVLTELETKKLQELKEKRDGLQKELFTFTADNIVDKVKNTSTKDIDNQEEIKQKSLLIIKINDVNSEIARIQNSYLDIFDNTAETKTKNDTIEWWSLFLIYIDEDDKGYKCLFGKGDPSNEDDFFKKLVKLEELEDKSDIFYNEVIKKMSYLISFWYTANTLLSKIDYQTMEKVYLDNYSDYPFKGVEITKENSQIDTVENTTTENISIA